MLINIDTLVRAVRARARAQVAHLSDEMARSGPDAKESVLAALEFERWLAETCDLCLQPEPEGAL